MAASRKASWRAMGCPAEAIVVGHADSLEHLLARARDTVADCESRWSRFIDDSEISRMNAAALEHRLVAVVSKRTCDLLVRALVAWRATAGAFDPTVLDAVLDAGYTRSFVDGLPAAGPSGVAGRDPANVQPRPSPGCAEVEIDPSTRTVRVPKGVGFDPGGIGKGLAADFAVEDLRRAGALGACVNIGGDVRVWGVPPNGPTWEIGVEDPWDASLERARIAFGPEGGAVATTSPLARCWVAADGRDTHHLIDPSTGRPAHTAIASVSVLASEAWWAEAWAKAAYLGGRQDGPATLVAAGHPGLFVGTDGSTTVTNSMLEHLN